MSNQVINICLTCGHGFMALQTEIKRGKGKYCSKVCYNTGRIRKSLSLREILYRNISTELIQEDCWLYSKLIMKGYGHLNVYGIKIGAHRISYEIHVGEIPEGMYVCHKCDVRNCVNPNHLFLGTHLDNMRDMAVKNKLRKSTITLCSTNP